jgi:hypothetical protein
VVVTLQFTLPDEEQEYLEAMRGAALRAAVADFKEWLRRKMDAGEVITVFSVWDRLHGCLADHDLEGYVP